MEERPRVPITGIVIGDIIYWVCIIGCLFAMIGPPISILFPDNNVADPFKIFSLVWEGKSSDEVWAVVTQEGKYPGAHFWIKNLTKGDGITQLGCWLACACSLPAAFVGGIVYLFRGDKLYFIVSWWVAFMVLFSMLGILKMAE